MTKARAAAFDRQTSETQIRGRLVLDGQGRYDVGTGIRFSTTCSSCLHATAGST